MGLLRLLLAYDVIAYHTVVVGKGLPILNNTFLQGRFAVDIFFMISGFYMALVLRTKYIGKSAYKTFIVNRILRLYPTYFLVLFITVLFYIFWESRGFETVLGQYHWAPPIFISPLQTINDIWLIIRNITLLFPIDFFTFNDTRLTTIVIPAWSLQIEMIFYLIAPFLVKRSLRTLVILTIISLLIRHMVMRYALINTHQIAQNFLPGLLSFFLLGILGYHIYEYLQKKFHPGVFIKLLIYISPLFLFFIYQSVPNILFKWSYIKDQIYIGIFFLLIPPLFSISKNMRFDALLGYLSFPVYLTHYLIMEIFLNFKLIGKESSVLPYAVIFTSTIVSFGIVYYLEKPIDTFRHKLKFSKSNLFYKVAFLKTHLSIINKPKKRS